MKAILEGSHAIAEAVRLVKPDVISAYPITPQTHIVERLAEMVAEGELESEYICVESEFSALSACVGASAAGSRVYSATSSQGLLFMAEVCFNAAGMRQPIVMSIANRAVSAPLSIWNDQQDSLCLRDSGWIQLYAEDVQESFDLHILAYKVAEDHRVLLPVFVCFDGFIISHTYEPVDIPDEKEVQAYLPPYDPVNKLDADEPLSMGMYATPEYYMEFRYEMDQAMVRALSVLKQAGKEFKEQFGRDYSELVESYKLEDAEVAIVAMGSICGTIKDAVDEMRSEGKKVGLLKIRAFRPFPAEDVKNALKGIKKIGVFEKNISIGSRMKGAVGYEVKDAIGDSSVQVLSYVAGLGGRDIRILDIKKMTDAIEAGNGDCFFGLREELI
ncbi:pyruvate ferredoxin oxidoreductase [Methanospirillum sp. J.3.6.1-F.2.7.3]|jgi:pyruvate ferredoxin oxidoreductase alpha subunit|uniref:Pyruvate ferredoxin oxidoreductase n=2 Tax=Methanospirillum TaxID=2202 RepID=A0A8E7B0B1_9EURY|nr:MULTISPECIES: transketolase C-terminal domain-containing protein [Methanospirillum]MDX8550416.1 transketolase C-terminal domain-containing protein [Methanospirillum hungatei]QVV88113.1 pyruvate ferredoxin oxidoreductase [Methanospirillum sp. J.3.6.1-F.2.7.3]QXO95594.1 pyruvate ferredoxin oxidoreductase [Methanospirillum hungatei]